MIGNNIGTSFPQLEEISPGRLRELFDALVDMPSPEREAWLEANVEDAMERSAVLRLLDADAGVGFLDALEDEARLPPDTGKARSAGSVGRRIGGFRLIRPLGRGGMPRAFLAPGKARESLLTIFARRFL